MWHFVAGVAAFLVAVVAYYVDDLIRKRRLLDGLPQPPMKNLLIGHLHIGEEVTKLFPRGVHPQQWSHYVQVKYNLPEIFYLDLRPFGPLTMYVGDPQAASQYVTTGQSLPKSRLAKNYIERFLGKNNLVTLEGARWKAMRAIFNPGFSPANIAGLTDVVVDATMRYRGVLLAKAASGEHFQLEECLTRLTIEVIGRVVLDVDLDAQAADHPITRLFRERVRLMPSHTATVFPWQDANLARMARLWRNGRALDAAIGAEVDRKIVARAAEMAAEEEEAAVAAAAVAGGTASPDAPRPRRSKKRSVVDLALDAYEEEQTAARGPGGAAAVRIRGPGDVPGALRAVLVDAAKTFVFAGHDTTASTLAWAMYLLHRHPAARARLRAELDAHLPPDPDAAAAALRADPHLLARLDYTTAVLRETMRVFPTASTVREAVPGGVVVNSRTGEKIPMLPGAQLWCSQYLLHRNPRFFPRPAEFIPERFLAGETPFPEAGLFSASDAAASREAFRPFERGPRGCIGQELAMLEARAALALTARDLDFVLAFPGERPDPRPPVPGARGAADELDPRSPYGRAVRNGSRAPDRVDGHRVYQELLGAAKPTGGCPGRVYLRGSE